MIPHSFERIERRIRQLPPSLLIRELLLELPLLALGGGETLEAIIDFLEELLHVSGFTRCRGASAIGLWRELSAHW